MPANSIGLIEGPNITVYNNSGADIAENTHVALDGTSSALFIAQATAAQIGLGFTLGKIANLTWGTIRLLNAQGTFIGVTADAITVGTDLVYAAAAGLVSKTSTSAVLLGTPLTSTTGSTNQAIVFYTDLGVTGTWSGATIPINKGGTGQTTAIAAAIAFEPASVVLTGTTAITVDWSTAKVFSQTLAASTTLTFTNTGDGQTIKIYLLNTASNFTVTWPAMKWTGGSSPTQTVGAKTDVYTVTKVGTTFYGTAVQNLS